MKASTLSWVTLPMLKYAWNKANFFREYISDVFREELYAFYDTKKIEVDFRIASPNDLHSRVLTDGCCLIRSAIPRESVLRYGEMTEAIYRDIATRLQNGERINDFERVNIKNGQFIEKYGQANSLFNLLEDPKFKLFLDVLFGVGGYREAEEDTYSRSIHRTYKRHDKTSFAPLDVHFDGIYHSTWPSFAINFWIPFSDCGPGTNYPGLLAYPVDFRKIRRYLNIPNSDALRDKMAVAEPMLLLYPSLEQLYRDENIMPVAPRFEVGDVFLFNSWVPHATYWDARTIKCRRSLEIRFEGKNWNPVIL